MPSPRRKLALTILLSHPLSVVQARLAFVQPADTQDHAADDVVTEINRIAGGTLSPAEKDDIKTFLKNSGAIKNNGSKHKLSSNPAVIAKAFDAGYDPSTGCPNDAQAADIFATLA